MLGDPGTDYEHFLNLPTDMSIRLLSQSDSSVLKVAWPSIRANADLALNGCLKFAIVHQTPETPAS